ncbi:hypothetical protein Pan241w_53570 [Gimesia alba]|uniref:Uncharacterized protein n=1 Tax=Gimesia alba TaxID=2527973 RepID=A0A517RMY6_9PLAN|nr:hypothetical protein [Gimesia alba]QDT45238.1 hypothetical protein Pan241w_53570 [Gimesia alba]
MDNKHYLVLTGASLTPCVLYSLSLLLVFFGDAYLNLFPAFRLEGFTIKFLCVSAIGVATFCLFYLGIRVSLNWIEKLLHFFLWTVFSITMVGFSFLFTLALIIVIYGFPVPD